MANENTLFYPDFAKSTLFPVHIAAVSAMDLYNSVCGVAVLAIYQAVAGAIADRVHY